MKYIHFLRHGKAEPYSFEKQDFIRDLTTRGEQNCQQISQILLRTQILPELIIASPANRTLQTAQLFAETLGFNKDQIITMDFLYDYVGVETITRILSTLNDAQNVLMLVGHNPWVSNMASAYTNDFFQDLPTTGLVCLSFEVDHWKDIEARSGKVHFFEYPKKYD